MGTHSVSSLSNPTAFNVSVCGAFVICRSSSQSWIHLFQFLHQNSSPVHSERFTIDEKTESKVAITQVIIVIYNFDFLESYAYGAS